MVHKLQRITHDRRRWGFNPIFHRTRALGSKRKSTRRIGPTVPCGIQPAKLEQGKGSCVAATGFFSKTGEDAEARLDALVIVAFDVGLPNTAQRSPAANVGSVLTRAIPILASAPPSGLVQECGAIPSESPR